MGFLYQVFRKIGGIAVFATCCLVFFIAGGELASLSVQHMLPSYALWQSGQVSLYMPERDYLSWA